MRALPLLLGVVVACTARESSRSPPLEDAALPAIGSASADASSRHDTDRIREQVA
jgi:hypothetical protein